MERRPGIGIALVFDRRVGFLELVGNFLLSRRRGDCNGGLNGSGLASIRSFPR